MLSSRSSSWRWAAALAFLAGFQAPARAGFTITDLGVIVPQGSSGAVAINASGQAAGMVSLAGGQIVAASSVGSSSLQQVTLPSGSGTSMATSINAAGQVAGYYTDKNNLEHGFFTSSSGAATSISPLMLNGVQGTYTEVNGINAGGTVVGSGDLPSGVTRAFYASGSGTPTPISPLLTGLSNVANGINDQGTVVGSSQTSPGGTWNAFFTVPGGPNGLTAEDLSQRNQVGNFTGNTYGMAIADDGDIVGHGDAGGSEHAFYAANNGATIVDMGTLSNASSSTALAVNDNGLVVGSSGPSAFLWSASTGMFNLNSLITHAEQANWVLVQAGGINDSNQITGEGYFDGVLHGFILTPIAGESLFNLSATIPTPPAVVLSGLGLAIVLGWSRWKLRRGRSGGQGSA